MKRSARIPGTSFTKKEDDRLTKLLKKVRSDGYRWPTEKSMRAAHGVVSFWATELVIVRGRGISAKILLTRYDGGMDTWRKRKFWHIPGGYNIPADQIRPERKRDASWWRLGSIQGVVSRVAKRELGMDVKLCALLDVFWWPEPSPKGWRHEKGEHPYGCPLSLYVMCDPIGKLQETETMKFFSVRKLPTPMIVPQREFVKRFLKKFV